MVLALFSVEKVANENKQWNAILKDPNDCRIKLGSSFIMFILSARFGFCDRFCASQSFFKTLSVTWRWTSNVLCFKKCAKAAAMASRAKSSDSPSDWKRDGGSGYCGKIVHYSPTEECYGVFAQYRFRSALGELGRFREGTGFREPVLETGSRFRCVPTGSGVPRSVPGTGTFSMGEVLRRFQVPEIALPRFGQLPLFWRFRSSGFRWVPRFRRLWSSWFWWVLTVSKVSVIRVSMGFRRFWDQELQKTCGTKFLASWGWHNGAGNAVRRVNAFV